MFPPTELEQDLAVMGEPPPEEMAIPEEIPEEVAEIEDESVDEKIKDALKDIIENFERKEQPVRERMIRFWRKCELFWDGIQDIIWDQVAKDYRSAREIIENEQDRSDLDPYYYNKIVNIFRAYGEAVIAALTPETPTITFPPDDGDNIADVSTSRGYTHISELVSKHNQAQLLLTRAIFILWNQGVVGSYKYIKESPEYGTTEQPKYEDVEQLENKYYCSACGNPDVGPPDLNGVVSCGACGTVAPPDEEPVVVKVPRIVGYEEVPKSRVCIEVYGPRDFEIPHTVVNPKHTPYINLKTECHFTYAQELYPEIADKIRPSYDVETYDRWGREHTQYQGEEDDIVTIRRVWLRSWVFNDLKATDEELYNILRAKFPNGVKVELVNDIVARFIPENMDDHWDFTLNPLSSHLHALPLGAPIVPIQEIRNELLLLKLQHVEYGIPETFADPTSLDFNTYGKQKATPGMVYPAKAQAGKALGDSFTTLKTAAYPKEVNEFQHELDQDAQFTVGAFPTIYGGAVSGGGKTAAEYNMSRNQALQRLGTVWKFISMWWANSMGKAVVLFHENMRDDEKYVQKNGDRYETVWIRRAELTGKVGQVEPEVGDNFPTSQAQKRDLLMQLLQLNNEYINAAIMHNENSSLVASLLGFREFYVPGTDDREKQLEEIQELLMGEPLDPNGQMPSVMPDQLLDDHQTELEACLAWMKSDIGRDARINNPGGYANVRAHAMVHQYFLSMQMMQQQEAQDDSGDDASTSGSDSQSE